MRKKKYSEMTLEERIADIDTDIAKVTALIDAGNVKSVTDARHYIQTLQCAKNILVRIQEDPEGVNREIREALHWNDTGICSVPDCMGEVIRKVIGLSGGSYLTDVQCSKCGHPYTVKNEELLPMRGRSEFEKILRIPVTS
jgi:hypothetical protein